MSRQVPAERWQAFVTVAAVSKTEKVLLACRSRAVQRQYEVAVAKLGGKPENLIFRILKGPSPRRD